MALDCLISDVEAAVEVCPRLSPVAIGKVAADALIIIAEPIDC
jgi:hypothetical protein